MELTGERFANAGRYGGAATPGCRVDKAGTGAYDAVVIPCGCSPDPMRRQPPIVELGRPAVRTDCRRPLVTALRDD